MSKKPYELYGPVQLADGRRAVFISAGYHFGCCQEAQILFADGHHELINPSDLEGINGAGITFSLDWYTWHRKRIPFKAWERFSDLKSAADAYLALGYEERGVISSDLTKGLPQHDNGFGVHYPWPYVNAMAADL